MTEADMAAKVVAYFKASGWRVYEEVVHPNEGTARADIVAVGPENVWVIECKLALGLDVMAQARRWLSFANRVSVAVARGQGTESSARATAVHALRLMGIGVLEVESLWPIDEGKRAPVTERLMAEHVHHINPSLLQSLQEGHQTHAKAGTNRGGHLTPFRQTIDAVAAFARSRPGEPLRAILSVSPHHYSSIANGVEALTSAQDRGQDLGFRLERDPAGVLRAYPTEAA